MPNRLSTLPDPSTISPTAARKLIREIRGDWRPQQLAELSGSYLADDGGALSRARILAEELRLQKLDQYMIALLPTLERTQGPLGWESFRPHLRSFRRCSSNHVEADVDLAFTPENHECVHGPCTIVPAMLLARRFLNRGERVVAIDSISWSFPLLHRVRLCLWDAEEVEAPQEKGAFHGRLRTSQGRALAFSAVPLLDHPILGQRGYNSLSQALVRGQRLDVAPDTSSFTLPFTEEGLELCRHAVRRRPGLCAALLLDLVPIGVLSWRPGRPMLDCGYSNVALPSPLAAAFTPQTRLEVRYRKDLSHRSTRSGNKIEYYDYRFLPWQENWGRTVIAEADSAAKFLRELHS